VQANPHFLKAEMRTGGLSPQTDRNHTAEKNFVREKFISPYRKPTQVDGMSILRCSSEPWLRNSAN
jgi:hypothetical protein